MAISSDRIVKRFYIGGNMDQQAGTTGSDNEGFATFAEALDAVEALYAQPYGNNFPILYITECYRVLRAS